MFGRRVTLFRLFGFKVQFDLVWILLAGFILWSLAEGVFPYFFQGYTRSTYWWMGVAGVIGFFFSILFHELAHSMMARFYRVPITTIRMYIFGGVPEMDEEPPDAKAEFVTAITGPIASFVLASASYVAFFAGVFAQWPETVVAFFSYMIWLNLILAAFNLLPALPLDGGHILRSILWSAKKDFRWATRIAVFLGSVVGLVVIAAGIVVFFYGYLLAGVWIVLIGVFVEFASRGSIQELIVRSDLEGYTVEYLMSDNPVTVPMSLPIDQLVKNYFYRYRFKMFPVTDNDRLAGCVTVWDIRQIPKNKWPEHQTRELLRTCSPDFKIPPKTRAVDALSQMNRSDNKRLIVVDGNRVVGVITLRDLVRFLSIKAEFEKKEQ